jgi:penicillin-binding protein 1C
MLAAMKGRTPLPLTFDGIAVERAEICTLSGKRPTPACRHRVVETFLRGTVPEVACDMHVKVPVDRRNGGKAGPSCPANEVEDRVFELYEPMYTAWALGARRPLVPSAWSPLCAGTDSQAPRPASRLAIRYPYPDASYHIDPGAHDSAQGVVVRADAPVGTRRIRFVVDGRTVAEHGAPFEQMIRLEPGHHRVHVEADGMEPSLVVEFRVQ